VVGDWRRLHNEKLHNLYAPSNIIKVISQGGSNERVKLGEVGNAYNTLTGNPEGKKQFGRPRRRWEDNIRMYLREIIVGSCGLDPTGSGY